MIVFVSNFVSPHIIPLCDELYRLHNHDFLFVETMRMSTERKDLGYNQLRNRKYVIAFEEYSAHQSDYQKVINEASVVLASFASVDNKILYNRIKENNITFLLSERIFKKGIIKLIDSRFWKNLFFIQRIKNKNFHLLCMGAYVAQDFSLCGFKKEKMWKFGYITKRKENHISIQIEDRLDEIVRLIWIGRMIWWKHPFHVIKAAKKIKKKGIKFTLHMIGGGKLEEKIKKYLTKVNISEISYHGLMKNSQVGYMMTKVDVLVCTSNRLEGWGAVINEGMNAGCLVVANEKMGATSYLIKNKITGYSYRGGVKELTQTLIEVIGNKDLKKIARNGYQYIREYWNAEIAAQRLLYLISEIKNGTLCSDIYEDGICSKA